jgi:uncharacterized protein
MHSVTTDTLPTPDESHVSYAVNRLVEAFNPLEIVVFGSYARGDARPGSDLDLLVVVPEPENRRETAIAMRRVLKDMPIPKDIVVATPEELIRRKDAFWHVIGLAQKEGQVVYRVGGDGV